MIISHKYKFIFIKTEKTAGTSLEIALSEFCGPTDVISPITDIDEKVRAKLGFRGSQNCAIPFSKYTIRQWLRFFAKGKKATFYNHMSISELKRILPKNTWDSYYKFCFDRNPWDKMISWYYWNNRKGGFSGLEGFLAEGFGERLKGFSLYAINDVVAVDDVYKYEELSESLDRITDRLKLEKPLKMPEYRAKSEFRAQKSEYREMFSSVTKEKVEAIAKKEIALLNYSF